MFAEGLVSLSVTFTTVVNQRTHVQKSAQMRQRWRHNSPKMCIVSKASCSLRDHVFQSSETTPDTPTNVLPNNGCILTK